MSRPVWYRLKDGGARFFHVTVRFRVSADVATLALGMHLYEEGKPPGSLAGVVRIARRFREYYGNFDGQGNEDFTPWGGAEWGPQEAAAWNRAAAILRHLWPAPGEVPADINTDETTEPYHV